MRGKELKAGVSGNETPIEPHENPHCGPLLVHHCHVDDSILL